MASAAASSLLSKTPFAIFSGFLILTPLLAYLAPRSLAFIPLILMLSSAVFLKTWRGQWISIDRRFLVISLLIVGLALLSSFWAINSDFAFERSLKIAMILIPGAVLFSQMRMLDFSEHPRLKYGFIGALILAGLGLTIDLFTRAGPYFSLNESLRDLDNFSDLNRSILAFVILSACGLFALKNQRSEAFAKTSALVLVLLLLTILFKTHSQSAQLVPIIAITFACLFPIKRKAAWYALAAAIAVGVLTAPWLAQYMFTELAANIGAESWLSKGYASARMEIWDFIARKSLESPFYGFGIEGTRFIESFDTKLIYANENHVLHPHNFAIQIWMEFGAIGAALTTAIILAILHQIHTLPNLAEKRFILTLFVTMIIISSMSYGLWQSWWLGLYMILAALCALLAAKKA